jgi:hypothetical protein
MRLFVIQIFYLINRFSARWQGYSMYTPKLKEYHFHGGVGTLFFYQIFNGYVFLLYPIPKKTAGTVPLKNVKRNCRKWG